MNGTQPGTIYYRSLRRHDRRARALTNLKMNPLASEAQRLSAWALLQQAARLTNSLAHLAGYGGPLPRRPTVLWRA